MNFLQKIRPTQSRENMLDTVLYTVPGTKTPITWADSLEGTLILGTTGSGKSSGPGKYTASAMLKSGFGFLVLCAKSDEAKRWIRYAEETGRSDDVVLFNEESGLEFNLLQYEIKREGKGAGQVLTLVERLMNLNEQNRIHLSGGDGTEEPFWNSALRRLMGRAIGMLLIVEIEISMKNLELIVTQAFNKEEAAHYNTLKNTVLSEEEIDPNKREQAVKALEEWRASSFFIQVLELVVTKPYERAEERRDAADILSYWQEQFPRIPDETRSSIIESFLGVIEPFMQTGILKTQFSRGLSQELMPENIIHKNKIVICDFPVKEYVIPAVFAATIYKTAFQAAAERRNIEDEENPKPVCLWTDEYQTFCSPLTDSIFQSTARSSWVATTYLTQNLNNLYFVMGNKQPEARAKSLLGNMNLKYFCSNADDDSNRWASNMIGEEMAEYETLNISKDQELSKTRNQRLTKRVRPDEFTIAFEPGVLETSIKSMLSSSKLGKAGAKTEPILQKRYLIREGLIEAT